LLDGIALAEPLQEASIASSLKRLERLVTAHLDLEERVLYPALEVNSSAILRRKAARYRAHMHPIGQQFLETCRTWQTPGAISAAPSRFVDEWRTASDSLRMRMESEDEDLYVLAEAWIEHDR
jgi:hypothetical protein